MKTSVKIAEPMRWRMSLSIAQRPDRKRLLRLVDQVPAYVVLGQRFDSGDLGGHHTLAVLQIWNERAAFFEQQPLRVAIVFLGLVEIERAPRLVEILIERLVAEIA